MNYPDTRAHTEKNRLWANGYRRMETTINNNSGRMRAAACIVCTVLLVCFALCGQPSLAQGNADEDERNQCLKCHGEKGSIKKFSDGDFISTYVDPLAFAASVHRTLRCTACHKEFSLQHHPERSFRNKLQYRIKESHVCRDCHKEGTIRSVAVT